jgi:hypothetical protein
LQAKKITIYKNGDQWFEGFELRFKPHKDFQSLEAMLIKISPRVDFISPVSHLFDTDGNLIRRLEELEEGQSYVAANSRRFVPANYGRTGEAFLPHRTAGTYTSYSAAAGGASQQLLQRRRRSLSSKSSSADSASKPGSGNTEGKIIKIVNNDEPGLSERVLLNLKTSQTFEEVVRDLGQVLRIKVRARIELICNFTILSALFWSCFDLVSVNKSRFYF